MSPIRVADPPDHPPRRQAAFGLVGGLGPGATIHYYRALSVAFAERRIAPAFFISHADPALVLDLMATGALEALADYLALHVASLARAGAEFAAIAAVSPHICAQQLKARIDIPFLDLIDCTRAELTERGAHRVTVLGTKFVMQSDLYGRLDGFETAKLAPDDLAFVDTNYMKIAKLGSVEYSGADIEGLRKIAEYSVQNAGVDTVILGATDLSLAFSEADCGFPALDCSRAHLDAIKAYALGDASPITGEIGS
jgi:aspartate racemase